MWVVELSCDCGDRAAGRKRWQYSGAHRCEPPLRAWISDGSGSSDVGQQDFALLAQRARHEGDLHALVDVARHGRSRADALVVGMGMDEEEAAIGRLRHRQQGIRVP